MDALRGINALNPNAAGSRAQTAAGLTAASGSDFGGNTGGGSGGGGYSGGFSRNNFPPPPSGSGRGQLLDIAA